MYVNIDATMAAEFWQPCLPKRLSLLLCYVLANFLDFIRVLTTYVFFALCLLEGNVVSVNKFSNMRMMRNDEYIIVCTFGGRRMSGFKVIEEGPQAPPPPSPRATVVGSKFKKGLPKGTSAFEIHRCLKRPVKQAGQVCGCCLVSPRPALLLGWLLWLPNQQNIYDQSKTKLRLAILAGVMHDANFDKITRKLKQRRRLRRQRERQTRNKFRLAKQQLCTCKYICLCTFLRHETVCIFSSFGDDVDARQRSSFSFPELR